MDEEKLKKLHTYLSDNWDGFNASIDDFRTMMQDENNVRSLHKNLSNKIEGFTASFDDFYNELKSDKKKAEGIGVSGGATAKVGVAEEVKPPEFISPEKRQQVAQPASTMVDTGAAKQISYDYNQAEAARKNKEKIAQSAIRLNLPVEIVQNAVDIVDALPIKEEVHGSYAGGFMNLLYRGVGDVFSTFSGASNLVK